MSAFALGTTVTDFGSIKRAVDDLTAVEGKLQAAPGDGLDPEQPIARVRVPEVHGYARFGWGHPGRTARAADKDLQ